MLEIPDWLKIISYIISVLLILSLIISISVMDSKFHSKMFDDVNGLIREDTEEGVTTIVFISLIGYILLIMMASLGIIPGITNIIPEYAKNVMVDETYINGIIEMIVFAVIIIGLAMKSHDKIYYSPQYKTDENGNRTKDKFGNEILVPGGIKYKTQEGTATVVFICFIALVLFCFLMKYMSPRYGSYLDPLINNVFYIVILGVSIVLWLLKSIFGTIMGFPDSSAAAADKGKYVFDDFDLKLIPNYGLLFVIVGIIISILYKSVYDIKSLTTNTYVYILPIVILILFALNYAVPMFNINNGSGYGRIASIVMTAMMFLTIIYFYINMNSASFELTSYISGIIILFIIIVGLALTVYMLSNYLKSFTGLPGFIVYLIFYLPCLLIDFFKYIMNEFKMTSKVIYVLFFIEILLILLYVYIPQLIKAADKKEGVVLLQEGKFLDLPLVVGSSKILQIPKEKLENSNTPIVYLTNFTFSMWVYLNVQTNNFSSYAKETTIFDCGKGKPKLVYYNNIKDDVHKNKYIIYFTDVKSSPNSYEISLPIQKWNNFVFNYKSTQVDLFINGELVKVFKFTDNRPNYRPSDLITVGTDKGLDGAICNVRFYPYNVSKSYITTTYNLLMYKNPPTLA